MGSSVDTKKNCSLQDGCKTNRSKTRTFEWQTATKTSVHNRSIRKDIMQLAWQISHCPTISSPCCFGFSVSISWLSVSLSSSTNFPLMPSNTIWTSGKINNNSPTYCFPNTQMSICPWLARHAIWHICRGLSLKGNMWTTLNRTWHTKPIR